MQILEIYFHRLPMNISLKGNIHRPSDRVLLVSIHLTGKPQDIRGLGKTPFNISIYSSHNLKKIIIAELLAHANKNMISLLPQLQTSIT